MRKKAVSLDKHFEDMDKATYFIRRLRDGWFYKHEGGKFVKGRWVKDKDSASILDHAQVTDILSHIRTHPSTPVTFEEVKYA